MYEEKFKIKKEKLMKRLWGSNFYSPTEGKWSKTQGDGYHRGFNLFVWEPIMKVWRTHNIQYNTTICVHFSSVRVFQSYELSLCYIYQM